MVLTPAPDYSFRELPAIGTYRDVLSYLLRLPAPYSPFVCSSFLRPLRLTFSLHSGGLIKVLRRID